MNTPDHAGFDQAEPDQAQSDSGPDDGSATGSVPRDRALQPLTRRLPLLTGTSLRTLARRALPVAASVATAALATLAAERALSRAATRLVPHQESPIPAATSRRRRVVITERLQIERYRVRR
jgi:hypothetical protein